MHLFFYLTHFRELKQNYRNNLVRFLVQIKTLKFASDINRPLVAMVDILSNIDTPPPPSKSYCTKCTVGGLILLNTNLGYFWFDSILANYFALLYFWIFWADIFSNVHKRKGCQQLSWVHFSPGSSQRNCSAFKLGKHFPLLNWQIWGEKNSTKQQNGSSNKVPCFTVINVVKLYIGEENW